MIIRIALVRMGEGELDADVEVDAAADVARDVEEDVRETLVDEASVISGTPVYVYG